MAHEMAHIEHNHIIKKLSKEVGLSLLITIAGGNNSAEILKEITKTITSTAFDRDMERDADATGVQYLAKANIDPSNFANLLFRMSKKSDVPKNLEWISTHPNTKDRTSEILKLSRKYRFKSLPVVDSSSWEYVKKEVATSVKQ